MLQLWWLNRNIVERWEIYLDQKPSLGGKRVHLPTSSIWGISFYQQFPEPRYRGGVPEFQRSQTGTEPRRCSVQTYPHSARGRSSPELKKTFKCANRTPDVIWQQPNIKFRTMLNLPDKRNNDEIFCQDFWGKNSSESVILDFLFCWYLKNKCFVNSLSILRIIQKILIIFMIKIIFNF